jgi:hypothetical protein
MAINENDIELLHAYVDGELPTAECEGLWRRLASERELMTELDQLRADCSMRSMIWKSLEPDDGAVARVEARVMRATRREDIMEWAFNGLRIVASAAALILFGFAVGWMGRDRMYATPVTSLSSNPTQVVSASNMPMSSPQWQVEMRNENGKIVKVFTFGTEEEARQFINAWANHSPPAASGDSSGGASPDRF